MFSVIVPKYFGAADPFMTIIYESTIQWDSMGWGRFQPTVRELLYLLCLNHPTGVLYPIFRHSYLTLTFHPLDLSPLRERYRPDCR